MGRQTWPYLFLIQMSKDTLWVSFHFYIYYSYFQISSWSTLLYTLLREGYGYAIRLAQLDSNLGYYQILLQKCNSGWDQLQCSLLLSLGVIQASPCLSIQSSDLFSWLSGQRVIFPYMVVLPSSTNILDSVYDILHKLLQKPIPVLPQEALLNLRPAEIPWQQHTLMIHVLTAVKQLIPKAWLSDIGVHSLLH